MQRHDFLRLAIPKADGATRTPTTDADASASPAHADDTWCWHCCHPFTTDRVVLPVSYDARRNVWKFVGTFCSWSCAKAYNIDAKSTWNNACGQLLTLLHKKTTGKLRSIVPAPPRLSLRVFGGTLSIEEFRAKAPDGILVERLPLKMIPLETIYHERKVQTRRVFAEPPPDLEQHVSFETTAPVAPKNETLRLKRPKPKPSTSDVLARTMGLEIK